MKKYWIARVLKIFVFVVVATLVFGYVVQQLWNWLMPAVFGLHAITFVQALGLFLLSKILFGGFHGRRGRKRGPRRHWNEQMKERWAAMSDEEREKFRAGMRGRWCGPRSAEPTA